MNQSTIVVICALFGLAFTLYKYFASIEKRITKVDRHQKGYKGTS